MRGETRGATTIARTQIGLAVAALVLLFALVPISVTGDGHARWEAVRTLAQTGRLPEMRYSFIGPIVTAPAFLFGSEQIEQWWVPRYNVLLLAAGAAAAWWLLRTVVSDATRAAFVLLLVAGGMMPFHVRDFYGEVFTAVCAATGMAIVFANGHWAGWILVVLGVANTPATVAGLVLVAIWRVWRTRRFDAAIAVACAIALVLAENDVVRGDFRATGYAGDHGFRTVMPFSGRAGFSYPMVLGLVSLLFSFGRGLLFFAPGVLLILYARRRAPRAVVDLLDAWTIFLIGIVVIYSRWWAWYGGWYWGPRFLLFAAYPSALALAIALPSARAAAAVALWTVWVGASGAVYGMHGMEACMANNYALEHLCWYTPEFSPLFRPLVIATSLQVWQRAWLLLSLASAIALILPVALKRLPPRQSS
jgi:hypothetical protein